MIINLPGRAARHTNNGLHIDLCGGWIGYGVLYVRDGRDAWALKYCTDYVRQTDTEHAYLEICIAGRCKFMSWRRSAILGELAALLLVFGAMVAVLAID